MCLPEWRNAFWGVLAVVLSTALMAQDSGRAILRNSGGVELNGSSAPSSAVIFPNDLVQTPKANIATIDAEGSTATIQPESIVQFGGNELVLDHGGLAVETSREMSARVNCMTAVPLTTQRTRYQMTDIDGKVTVAAMQGDVKLHFQGAAVRHAKSALADVTVHQGEQVTRDERCGESAEAVTPGTPGLLDTTWAKVAGTAVIVGGTACILLCYGDEPISPDKP